MFTFVGQLWFNELNGSCRSGRIVTACLYRTVIANGIYGGSNAYALWQDDKIHAYYITVQCS